MKKINLFFSDSNYNTNFIEIISKELNFSVIKVGDVFRKVIKSETNLGIKVKKHIDSGELVPYKLVNKIIQNEILRKNDNVLIWGYPRKKEQLNLLKENFEITRVWYLSFENIDDVVDIEYKFISKIEIDKYEITKEEIRERILRKISENEKIINLLKFEFEISKIEIVRNSNYVELFKEKIKEFL